MLFMNFIVHSSMKHQLTESCRTLLLSSSLALNPETEPEGMRGRSLGTVSGEKAFRGTKLKMKSERTRLLLRVIRS